MDAELRQMIANSEALSKRIKKDGKKYRRMKTRSMTAGKPYRVTTTSKNKNPKVYQKLKTMTYKDTAQNRKLGRVGKTYQKLVFTNAQGKGILF